MKRSKAAEAALPSSKAPAKAQRRQKSSTPRSSSAASRARPAASLEHAPRKGGEDDKSTLASAAAGESQQSSSLPHALAEEDAVVGWGDGTAELGEWWWCLWGVEEEKLLGWFPFVDEDFLCADSRGDDGSGGLLWEEADHDIWQLQHIHEIPRNAAK